MQTPQFFPNHLYYDLPGVVVVVEVVVREAVAVLQVVGHRVNLVVGVNLRIGKSGLVWEVQHGGNFPTLKL
jgi:hypothetical protein